jgi:hypothetical protein
MRDAETRVVHGSRPNHRTPVGTLIQASIDLLKPTQMAVGMRSVTRKMRKVERRAGKRKKIEKLLLDRPIPAVCGPDGGFFIVDHHHFGMALCLAEVKSAYVHVIDDMSSLSHASFWRRMEADGRLYPYDEFGRRIQPSLLPPSLHALRHDPYRDLAWEVREADGFHKVAEPYAEFRWANFFREHISPTTIRRNPKDAVRLALKLCKSRLAARLPGYAH